MARDSTLQHDASLAAGPSVFDDKYDRIRRDPTPESGAYLHLKDISDALRVRLKRAEGVWLDFGSGTSPYRDYFERAELRRADVPAVGDPTPDYVIEPGQPCPAPDGSFDGILSTQVLQHVPDAAFYLRDAFRMLRPGGQLVLTAQSAWEDHPRPIDVGRWNAEGIRVAVDRAGFEVVECVRLTCGVRALLQLMLYEFGREPLPPRAHLSRVGAPLGALYLMARRHAERVNRFADRFFADEEIHRSGEPKFYLAVLVTARRSA